MNYGEPAGIKISTKEDQKKRQMLNSKIQMRKPTLEDNRRKNRVCKIGEENLIHVLKGLSRDKKRHTNRRFPK